MPPKKKVGAPLKVPKSESNEPELELPPPEPKKIPRKPLFIIGNLTSEEEVRKIRAKLWRVRSGILPQQYFPSRHFFWTKEDSTVEKFEKRLKNSTIQKSLRHIKRLSTDPLILFQSKLFRKLSSSWKLYSLKLIFRKKFQNSHVLKTLLNPKLRFCWLNFTEWGQGDYNLFLTFQRIVKCNLSIYGNINDETLSACVKMNQLRKLKRTKQAQDKLVKSAPLNSQAIIDAPECFKASYFSCTDMRIHNLPSLPNLQRFELRWPDFKNEQITANISFVKQYSMIKALTLRLGRHEIENFDALIDLTNLKELHLYYRHWQPRPYPTRILPNLTGLEKLTLSLHGNPLFSVEHVKDFINKNRGLKDLSLTLTVPDTATVLEKDEDFTLPEIETLQLELVKLEKPSGTAKIIAEILRNHHSIKELILKVEQSNSNLNALLFKDGVSRMKSLEKLTINFSSLSGGLEENKFKHLKDIFTNLTDLAELNLTLTADVLPVRELSSILDWLGRLENLKKLTLSAKCFKLTPAASNKLSNFIASLGHLKVREIDVREF